MWLYILFFSYNFSEPTSLLQKLKEPRDFSFERTGEQCSVYRIGRHQIPRSDSEAGSVSHFLGNEAICSLSICQALPVPTCPCLSQNCDVLGVIWLVISFCCPPLLVLHPGRPTAALPQSPFPFLSLCHSSLLVHTEDMLNGKLLGQSTSELLWLCPRLSPNQCQAANPNNRLPYAMQVSSRAPSLSQLHSYPGGVMTEGQGRIGKQSTALPADQYSRLLM